MNKVRLCWCLLASFLMSPFKDLKLIVWNYIDQQNDRGNEEFDFPEDLKVMIHSFSKQILDCRLLTNKEDMELYSLLSMRSKVSIKSFTTIYIASKNNYSAEVYHNSCDGKGPTVTIIKSSFGNIFGGYVSKPLARKNAGRVSDQDSFLFLLRSKDEEEKDKCPRVFEMKHSTNDATRNCHGRGPVFGHGYDASIGGKCHQKLKHGQDKFTTKNCSYTLSSQQASFLPKGYNIAGGGEANNLSTKGENIKTFDVDQYYFQVIDYYVIQINCNA